MWGRRTSSRVGPAIPPGASGPDGNGTKASHRSVGGGAWIASPPLLFRRRQALIETMRSIGTRARIARSSGTFTSPVMSRSASHSFGSVIIFM